MADFGSGLFARGALVAVTCLLSAFNSGCSSQKSRTPVAPAPVSSGTCNKAECAPKNDSPRPTTESAPVASAADSAAPSTPADRPPQCPDYFNEDYQNTLDWFYAVQLASNEDRAETVSQALEACRAMKQTYLGECVYREKGQDMVFSFERTLASRCEALLSGSVTGESNPHDSIRLKDVSARQLRFVVRDAAALEEVGQIGSELMIQAGKAVPYEAPSPKTGRTPRCVVDRNVDVDAFRSGSELKVLTITVRSFAARHEVALALGDSTGDLVALMSCSRSDSSSWTLADLQSLLGPIAEISYSK